MNIYCYRRVINIGFAIPEYELFKAADEEMEMEAMMKFALATTQAEVESAMASPDTGAYDLIRHIELRQ